MISDGVKNPRGAATYLRQVVDRQRADLGSELYRRRRGIPRQADRIDALLSNEEFVLVILDACRYDVFRDLHAEYLAGSLERVWSSGNWTQQWVSRTWDGEYDLTYVSTTPFTFDYAHAEAGSEYTPSGRFDEVIDVIGREWHPVLSTTPPEPVTDIALQTIAAADTTRAVVHYMQPHAPYIGDTRILQWDEPDEKISALLDYMDGDEAALDGYDDGMSSDGDSLTLMELVRRDLDYREERRLSRANYESMDAKVRRGDLSLREYRTAYRDNLRHVLGEVQRLISYLDCPVVVSADHGEHLGRHREELPRLGHPDWTHPVLREVPWFVVDAESRGDSDLSEFEPATTYDPDADGEPSDETLTDRLAALGYR